MTGDLLRIAAIEGAGAVSLFAHGATYDLVRTDRDGNVTSDIDDYCIVGAGEAEKAWWEALEHLCWLDSPAGRNAARDVAIDDAQRGRDAHPAGKGGRHV